MIPEQITYISVYLMFSKARLIDTLLPQILPFGANAFGIFLLIMAGNLILVVPILIIYCFGSKQIIKAFTYNGIK